MDIIKIPGDMLMRDVVRLHVTVGGILQSRFGQALIAPTLLPLATRLKALPSWYAAV